MPKKRPVVFCDVCGIDVDAVPSVKSEIDTEDMYRYFYIALTCPECNSTLQEGIDAIDWEKDQFDEWWHLPPDF